MSAPVRLITTAVAAPRPLVAALARIADAAPPAWIGAKAQPARPMLAAAEPRAEASALEVPAAPAVDDGALAAALEAAQAAAVAAALAEGERAGIAQGQAKVEAIIDRYADGIARLAEAEARRASDDAESAIQLALVLAQELLGRELSIDRTFLVTMVTEALATAGDREPLRLRMGPSDLAYLETLRPEVLRAGVEIVADDSLGIGGCVIESEHRVIDASLGSRLAAVGHALRDALSPRGEEPA